MFLALGSRVAAAPQGGRRPCPVPGESALLTPPAGDAIRVLGLQKSFGDWPVLWDLDLTVPWGELLVLFGANGVGKTTLLRILSTQARPDAGSLVVAGFDQRRSPQAVRRRVGVVAHQSFHYDDLTCRENLYYYGRLFGIEDYRARADEVLARLGLDRRSDRRVRTLSNGMQKRLSIARAIQHRPRLLLLDEPEAGLDEESLDILKDLLHEWTQAGGSAIMTTHDTALGRSWAHRTAVLDAGRVLFPSPDEYPRDKPSHRPLAASMEPRR